MARTGRPLKWKTVAEIEPLIEAYFCDTKMDEWTITGLALALDTSRETLLDYEGKDEFSDTIKKAKLKVEYSYEIDLKKSGRTGTIFALKNFDWKDKTEQAITMDATVESYNPKAQEIANEFEQKLKENL